MKYGEGSIGRIFVVRLEDGDKLPEVIENFAKEKELYCALCVLLGGIESDGKLVVGPENSKTTPIVPLVFTLKGVHEILGVGTLFPDENNFPRLHMHAALGREGKSRTGCIRLGIEVWEIGEVILLEIKDIPVYRKKDPDTGFEIMEL